MRHAFIVDPLTSLGVDQDTTIAFMREAQSRGHKVYTCEVDSLGAAPGGKPVARVAATRMLADFAAGEPWYEVEAEDELPLDDFDVVWMRKDPPYDLEYLYATHLLSLVGPPALVVNDPRGLREVDEKLYALRFPDICPESLVSRRIDDLLAFREKLGGEMIIKPIGGAGGTGVFHLSAGDRNVNSILELATAHGTRYQVAQRYLPEIRDGDKRIILVDGEPVGAVLRVPQHWESRANFHVGGSAVATEVTAREHEICDRIRPALLEEGILFAGIDVIGQYLTEINVTSPTGIREILALGGPAIEVMVLDAVERRVEAARR